MNAVFALFHACLFRHPEAAVPAPCGRREFNPHGRACRGALRAALADEKAHPLPKPIDARSRPGDRRSAQGRRTS